MEVVLEASKNAEFVLECLRKRHKVHNMSQACSMVRRAWVEANPTTRSPHFTEDCAELVRKVESAYSFVSPSVREFVNAKTVLDQVQMQLEARRGRFTCVPEIDEVIVNVRVLPPYVAALRPSPEEAEQIRKRNEENELKRVASGNEVLVVEWTVVEKCMSIIVHSLPSARDVVFYACCLSVVSGMTLLIILGPVAKRLGAQRLLARDRDMVLLDREVVEGALECTRRVFDEARLEYFKLRTEITCAVLALTGNPRMRRMDLPLIFAEATFEKAPVGVDRAIWTSGVLGTQVTPKRYVKLVNRNNYSNLDERDEFEPCVDAAEDADDDDENEKVSGAGRREVGLERMRPEEEDEEGDGGGDRVSGANSSPSMYM